MGAVLIPPPSIAVIIPLMDRADHLRQTLSRLLTQDYPYYTVHIVDNSSRDDLESVLKEFACSRLQLIRRPRPRYFSFSVTRNCGARYTFSEMLLFLDADISFQDTGHLSLIVSQFLHESTVDYDWFAEWRNYMMYEALVCSEACRPPASRFRNVYCHCLGSPILLERQVFQSIGGYNEALDNWGYEDTDLCARLELCGFGRVEMGPLSSISHDDDLRVRNFQVKDKALSWQQNRLASDESIRTYGAVSPSSQLPGRSSWVEIDGIRWDGASAPQQDWCIPASSR